jgi:hypothetical protein
MAAAIAPVGTVDRAVRQPPLFAPSLVQALGSYYAAQNSWAGVGGMLRRRRFRDVREVLAGDRIALNEVYVHALRA